ncbi:MAG: MATE family efflux transporter, partial [Clostridia bacterium]|nr:MATE family efflux transporter [Clostridia bacterium]
MTGNVIGQRDADLAYRQGITFTVLSALIGVLAGGIILLLSPLIIGAYNITEETRRIAFLLIDAVSIMVVFQTMQSMLTKGVLRGGGDTRFLMIADIAFMWICSIPLGYLTAFVWQMNPFWIYVLMKIDYIIKTIWCLIRLFQKKWIKMVARDAENV